MATPRTGHPPPIVGVADRVGLAAFLLAAGVAHFVIPRSYQRIVPGVFHDPAFWVRWTGVAEIGCAALVVHPRTRRLGGYLAIGLFVAVFPANVKMALDGGIAGQPFPLGSAAVAWARLPLQIPLVLWARRVAGDAKRLRRTPAVPAPFTGY